MDFIDDNTDVKQVSLDLNLVKSNIPKFSSQKLCEMIVCDRYFGFNEQISVLCMEELSKRRLNGDKFLFEDYIDQASKELPPLEFKVPDLRSVLNQAIKSQKK